MTKTEIKNATNEMIIFRISQLSIIETKKALKEENALYQELSNRGIIDMDKMNEIRRRYFMINE